PPDAPELCYPHSNLFVTNQESDDRRTRHHACTAPRLVCRHARGLFQTARADRSVPGFFGGAAACAFGLDIAHLDARGRRRSRYDWALCTCWDPLHDQVPVGASCRRARRACSLDAARPTARLAYLLPAPVNGRDRLSRVHRSDYTKP